MNSTCMSDFDRSWFEPLSFMIDRTKSGYKQKLHEAVPSLTAGCQSPCQIQYVVPFHLSA